MTEKEDKMAERLLNEIEEMERRQARSDSDKTSFSLAELAQSIAGYLIYKSSRRVERASWVLAILTVVLVALTVVLILRP